jgi:hypothetical protein
LRIRRRGDRYQGKTIVNGYQPLEKNQFRRQLEAWQQMTEEEKRQFEA